MMYREVQPHPKLRKFIKCFWMLDHDYGNSVHDHERLWADAHTELIFTSGHRTNIMRIKRALLQLSFYVLVTLLCLSPNLRAQGLTEPVTASRVGPEGGTIHSIVVDPSDSNTIYAVSNPGVFKSTDRGTTWSYSGLAGTNVSTIAISLQIPATVYAAAPGTIFKSLDAG